MWNNSKLYLYHRKQYDVILIDFYNFFFFFFFHKLWKKPPVNARIYFSTLLRNQCSPRFFLKFSVILPQHNVIKKRQRQQTIYFQDCFEKVNHSFKHTEIFILFLFFLVSINKSFLCIFCVNPISTSYCIMLSAIHLYIFVYFPSFSYFPIWFASL